MFTSSPKWKATSGLKICSPNYKEQAMKLKLPRKGEILKKLGVKEGQPISLGALMKAKNY
jgi:hypothetical protein